MIYQTLAFCNNNCMKMLQVGQFLGVSFWSLLKEGRVKFDANDWACIEIIGINEEGFREKGYGKEGAGYVGKGGIGAQAYCVDGNGREVAGTKVAWGMQEILAVGVLEALDSSW